MNRAALRRRYLSLGLGELAAAAAFALIAAASDTSRSGGPDAAALWSARVPCSPSCFGISWHAKGDASPPD